MNKIETIKKPWGNYKVLKIGINYKIKLLTIFPGEETSLQKHNHRSEYMLIKNGEGIIYLGEDIENIKKTSVKNGSNIFIKKNLIHKISNNSQENLELNEIQIGTKIDENDIIRYQDKYGRIN